jgi:hypothetical protein
MERILMKAREDEPAQPRWKVGLFLGTIGGDVEVLEADENTAGTDLGGTAQMWRIR